MSVLHAYFHLRKQNEFQRWLEQAKAAATNSNAGPLSSSGGSGNTSRSWSKLSSLSTQVVDVNARDWLGRTVLHLACSALDPAALEFARLLLAHPHINLNIQDQESHWTPLHRALYAGNISAAVLLVQRSDTDMFMKDVEGYTAFDLYNSTVEGTNPPKTFDSKPSAGLYTWGSNRNATLGLGDDDDRSLPEQVIIRRDKEMHTTSLCERLKPLTITGISMSRLHTTIITEEPRNNLRSCGFASDGRLGPAATSSHAQFSLINPQRSLSHAIVAVALGQDHTLVVTANGEVLSWGLNRFGQLGYVIEGNNRALETQVQLSARKITGALRNQVVLGVACCKSASACWTAKHLFTWGSNAGQLGYEKASQPQVLPRLVPYVSEPVLAVAMTESSMLVLLESRDVICVHDGAYWKLQFTTKRRASKPINKERVEIQKITASEGNFALVSEIGDVYFFNIEETSAGDKPSRRPFPILVWAVRRQFLAVRDVALGSDGSMILCTTSGHVFIQKCSPPFKFHRVPNLQRIYSVAANSTGAFAALRLDAIPQPIDLTQRTVSSDLDQVQPFRNLLQTIPLPHRMPTLDEDTLEQSTSLMQPNEEDDLVDLDIAPDIKSTMEMCRYLADIQSIPVSAKNTFQLSEYYGANVLLKVGSSAILVHRSVLLARVPALGPALKGGSLSYHDGQPNTASIVFDGKGNNKGQKYFTVVVRGCLPTTILLLCHYLYTDKVVAIWDRRVTLAIMGRYGGLQINTSTVKDELRRLASPRSLQLPFLEIAAQSAGKVSPAPSLGRDLVHMFDKAQDGDDKGHDVVIKLSDRQVKAHSVALRARSLYFSTFFEEECWTTERLNKKSGVIEVDLSQFNYRPMSYLFRYLYSDVSAEIFDDIDFINTTDQLVDFMFEVISCSNHLLMDGFTRICSSIILQLVDLSNVSSILVDAAHFNATALVESLHGYMAKNLETMMETHALDDLPLDVLKGFSLYIRRKQMDYHPYIRRGGNLAALEQRWATWLAIQDIPPPFVPRYLSSGLRLLSALPSRETTSAHMLSEESKETTSSPPRRVRHTQPNRVECEDEMFPMDGDVPAAAINPSSSPSNISPTTSRVWKSASVSQKIDMKSIMEAEQLASDGNKLQRAKTNHLGQSPTTKGAMKPPVDKAITHLPQAVFPQSKPSTSQRAPQAAASTSPQQTIVHTPMKQTHHPSLLPCSPSSPWNTPTKPSNLSLTSGRSPFQPIDMSKPIDNTSKPAPNKSPSTTPDLGPMMVPIQMKPPINPMRRRSSGEGAAWSSPAPQALLNRSNASHALSFQAIQEQQASKPLPKGPPKSLRQIQDEEQEAAFLTWFEEESARIQRQEAALLADVMAEERSKEQHERGDKSGQVKHPRGEQGGRGRGRGRRRERGRGKEHPSSSALVS